MGKTHIYTVYGKAANAELALIYWTLHQEMTIFAGRKDGYAVTTEARTYLFPRPGWTQVSPEEIEDALREAAAVRCLEMGP